MCQEIVELVIDQTILNFNTSTIQNNNTLLTVTQQVAQGVVTTVLGAVITVLGVLLAFALFGWIAYNANFLHLSKHYNHISLLASLTITLDITSIITTTILKLLTSHSVILYNLKA